MISALKFAAVSTAEAIARVVFCLPRHRSFNWLKKQLLEIMGAQIGRRVVFYPGVWIMPGRNLIVGDDVDLALDVIITTGGGVTIGDRTLVGYRTQILSTNHVIPERHGRIFSAGHEGRPVVIGSDVWIGANCLILGGCTIGEGAVVAAGSIVTKTVLPFTVVAGNPARVIKERI